MLSWSHDCARGSKRRPHLAEDGVDATRSAGGAVVLARRVVLGRQTGHECRPADEWRVFGPRCGRLKHQEGDREQDAEHQTRHVPLPFQVAPRCVERELPPMTVT